MQPATGGLTPKPGRAHNGLVWGDARPQSRTQINGLACSTPPGPSQPVPSQPGSANSSAKRGAWFTQTYPEREFLQEVRDAAGVRHFVTRAGVRQHCQNTHGDSRDEMQIISLISDASCYQLLGQGIDGRLVRYQCFSTTYKWHTTLDKLKHFSTQFNFTAKVHFEQCRSATHRQRCSAVRTWARRRHADHC